MNETNSQLIQTGFTLDRLHQDKKIDDEAYTILKDRNKQAIIYTRCCTTLPSKEEVVSKVYNKVFSEELTFRKVFRDEINDAYYSGALDMHEELNK
jgi:anaerobic ribonucleoside-triphosphate reductase